MSTPESPPAGWYPAPDGSPTLWWWDGAGWTAPHQDAGTQTRGTAGLTALSTATRALLVFSGLTSVAVIATETFGITAVTAAIDDDGSASGLLVAYDEMTLLTTGLYLLAFAATAAVWLVWQHQAAKQVADRLEHSPGWHVAFWFIPIVSLWVPYKNISDLWKAVGEARPWWQVGWWTCWIATHFVSLIAAFIYRQAQNVEQLRTAMGVTILANMLLLIAAACAWMIVRELTPLIVARLGTRGATSTD